MVIYSKAKDDADDDLEFKLRRSIDLIEREKAMAKKNGKKKSERATVSRERRLALALRALLDSLTDVSVGVEQQAEVTEAEQNAISVLDELQYGSLVGIPKRLKELNEQLKAAVDAGDGATIARIGAEMVKVQAGRETSPPKAAAAEA